MTAARLIRFPETEIRPSARASMGVRAVELGPQDICVGMMISGGVQAEQFVLSVTVNGFGKRTRIDEFSIQHRGGKGVILMADNARNGDVVSVQMVTALDDVIIMTAAGKLQRIAASSIRVCGRMAIGVQLMNVDAGDRVTAVARVLDPDDVFSEVGATLT